MTDYRPTRRRFVTGAASATVLALAGCSGGDGDGNDVPEEYRTATSIGGTRREPSSLSSKDAAAYQESAPGDLKCSNCTYYIEDQNGDGIGACAIVAGEISPDAYCARYVPHEG